MASPTSDSPSQLDEDFEDGKADDPDFDIAEEEEWTNIGETKTEDDRIAHEVHERKVLAKELAQKRRRHDQEELKAYKTYDLNSVIRGSETFIQAVLAKSLNRGRNKSKDSSTATGPAIRSRGRRHGASGRPTTDDSEATVEDESLDAPTRLVRQPSNITGGKLKPYQLEGLNWLIGLYESGLNGILADEMGLGKTLQTIALLAFLRLFRNIKGPHLVLAPKSTLGNWAAEFNRFCPCINVIKFHGNRDEREEMKESILRRGAYDVIVTSYELCLRERAVLQKMKFRYLIIDEAHRIKNEASKLSIGTRALKAEFRLLLTGTPLQNNLRELWALLNFLFPEFFASAQEFEAIFDLTSAEDMSPQEREERNSVIVQRLHKILRPFLLRRVKSEVMVELPPKKELLLYIPLSDMQKKLYRDLLSKNVDAISEASGGSRTRLLNLAMQLRKACNHPYLFEGYEQPGQDPFGEHVVKNSGKMVFLDRLLTRLIERGSRVLVFSQMTRMLDILDDYCRMRYYTYCRIDGNTASDDRDRMIELFNSKDEEYQVFLLSTRAGGLGINLTAADTVILFDSDWNPQVDLQAMDRAHRIGQTRPVNVYRLVHEHTVEEKVIERATLKLQLDSAIIEQGRLAAKKDRSIGKHELRQMVQFGADQIFKAGRSLNELTDADFESILRRGEEKHNEISSKLQAHVKKRLLDFSQSNSDRSAGALAEMFDDVDLDEERQIADREAWAAMAVEYLDEEKNSKRRVRQDYERTEKVVRIAKLAKTAPSRLPVMNDWQFFDRSLIKKLHTHEMELMQMKAQLEASLANEADSEEASRHLETLNQEMSEVRLEKVAAIQQGFSDWTRRDFHAFVRGCEIHGRDTYVDICREVGGNKTQFDVEMYAAAFWKNIKQIPDYKRIVQRIVAGEDGIEKRRQLEGYVLRKKAQYANPWTDIHLSGWTQSSVRKLFSEAEDRWLLNMVSFLGYGLWDRYVVHVRRDALMKYDWHLRSRSGLEFNRRAETLIRQLKKEEDAQKKRQSQEVKTTAAEGADEAYEIATPASRGSRKRKSGRSEAEASPTSKRVSPKRRRTTPERKTGDGLDAAVEPPEAPPSCMVPPVSMDPEAAGDAVLETPSGECLLTSTASVESSGDSLSIHNAQTLAGQS